MDLSNQNELGAPPDDKWFQTILDTLPLGAFLIDANGKASHYNKRLIDYLGFHPGTDVAARNALHHPDDQPGLERTRAAGHAAGSEYIVEARLLRHDGTYRWHRIHNKPLHHDGRIIGWIGTAVDIDDARQTNDRLEQRVGHRTAELEQVNASLRIEIEQRRQMEIGLRENEERFRTMYNRTPLALQSVDANARLLDVNDTWTELFGYNRSDVVGRSPTDFMTPASVEKYRWHAWPEMLHSRGKVRAVDYQFITRDGHVFDGRLAARGEFDQDGRFIRSWSAITDVTAEKHADRELRRAQRMDAVGQLTAGIAHDFNNLLTAILGNLEMLARRPLIDSERTDRLLSSARNAAERGAKLTAQLLAFSRQQRIVPKPADLNLIVEGMLPLLRGTLGAAIGIEFIAGTELWSALLDPAQMELAVLNLAINARDAMPDGGTITIETANVSRAPPDLPEEPAAGDYVAVSVSDTGPGIPDRIREHMFEPFFTTKDVGMGSGLGLSQVLGVVQQLGGGISVQSAPGDGTTISLFLPHARQSASQPQAEQAITSPTKPGPATTSTSPATGSGERILLVDDDENVRFIAADMLRDVGYDVTEASSGPAALDILKQGERPDAMVVDVAMPAMTGVELAAIVERTHPGMPLVFMTGYAAAGLLPANAAQDILHKPFQSAELEAKVARALGQRPKASA